MTTPYCNEDQVKLWMETARFDSGVLLEVLEAATEWVNLVTGDSFAKEDGVEKLFSSSGGKIIYVTPRIRSITTLEILDNDTWDTLDENGEFIHGEGWVRMRGLARFPIGDDVVKITGNWGREGTPALIKIVTARIAAAILDGGLGEVKSEHIGSYSVSYGAKEWTVSQVLEMYRLHKIMIGDMGKRIETYGLKWNPRADRWT